MKKQWDVIIVGTGVSGLFCALHLPKDKSILLLTKAKAEESDSFLAQGGICMLRDDADYESYFEDTMRAGHYENDPATVEIMIRSSQQIIEALVRYGVEFATEGDGFSFTREGAHSVPRILFHEDETGKAITEKLLVAARAKENITILEQASVLDLIMTDDTCHGVVCDLPDKGLTALYADYTVLATGGVGGIYTHSTNFRHLTGDGVALALRHNIRLQDVDYVQIHPTTLYSEGEGRRFLISESVRGEGAVLLNKAGERFVDELLPRDVVTQAIYKQMEADNMPYVRLSMAPIPKETILTHFPHIYAHCLEQGYDVTKTWIPVVPAQHYFMGGIWVDLQSKTSANRLYAVGETACNGVHGKNRLASNSLLESLVFAQRAALDLTANYEKDNIRPTVDFDQYENQQDDASLIFAEMERSKKAHESGYHEASRR